jgi:hypothetical protein
LNSKNSKKYSQSQIVHKNVTNLMVKTVSELESRVKNYRENEKWWVCMHACVKDGKVGSFFLKKSGSRG